MDRRNANEDWYERLSPKEREALETYAVLHSYDAVALALGKSESVVDRQLASARRKMGVTSTAEAMYLLAARKERLAADAAIASELAQRASLAQAAENGVAIRPLRLAPQALWRGLTLAALCLVAVGLWPVLAGGKPVARDQRGTPLEKLSDQDLIQRILASSVPGPESLADNGANRRETALVDELSRRAWNAMWGPKEDELIKAVELAAPQIKRSFDWALANDHDAAVRIVGNGHRIFYRVRALADWPQMLEQALALPKASKGIAYGRALCGVALARCLAGDNSNRGRLAAEEALRIFRATPGHDWDEANSIRHRGLWYKNTYDERVGYYSRALAIYVRIQDDRGLAHTYLSLGQKGTPRDMDPMIAAENLGWQLKAAHMALKLRNDRILSEALSEMLMSEPDIPKNQQHEPQRAQVRELFAQVAADNRASGNLRDSARWRVQCMKVDVNAASMAWFLEDVEVLLSDVRRHAFVLQDWTQVVACYKELCRREGRPVCPNAIGTNRSMGFKAAAARQMATSELVKLLIRSASS